ncbi:phosphomannomutase/phosphoglucomutase [Caldisericum sp.]|uniref:phosphomannomutase/phosphoglucomutase n=1 Tax=Caldisericum sp. TaxID=2499687 RepID=UPI003D0960B7
MSIFKAGDIRGLYPVEINEAIAFKVGFYFSQFAKGAFVVGSDFRRGSISLKQALIEGLSHSSQLKIYDIGQTTTPIFYFTSRYINADWGIMITASHNPPEYNGMKIIKGIFPLKDDEILSIEDGLSKVNFVGGVKNFHNVEKVNFEEEYISSLLKKFKNNISNKKIIFDIGNGAVGKIIDQIVENFHLDAIVLFTEPDPDFPSRNPNPALKESLVKLQEKISSLKGALGFAFDGDGDRLAVVDENAQIIEPDVVASIFIDFTCDRGNKVVYDIKSSTLVKKTILNKGCVPVLERSGYPYIKRTFVNENAILATEISGHYFFRDILQDDAIYASLTLLQVLGDKPLTEVKKAYKMPFVTPDIRINMKEDEADFILSELKRNLHNIIEIDGVYKEFENGFGLVRKSITEPVLTLRFEAPTKEELGFIIDEFLAHSQHLKFYEEIIKFKIN